MERIKQVLCGATLALGTVAFGWAQPAATMKVGAATVLLQPKGSDQAPPVAPLRTAALVQQAAPSSQWYSTLAFNRTPGPLFAQPLSFKTTPAGFEMALPRRQGAAEVAALIPFSVSPEHVVAYPHSDALVFSPLAFEPEPARLARVSDWSVDISMARGADQLLVTIGHGSPYAYFQLSRGDLRIRLPAPAERLAAVTDARQLGLRVKGTAYVIFGPTGVRWEQLSPTEWAGRLPEGKGYFSAAALPDEQPETLQLLASHAYAFVTDTTVSWAYDAAAAKVETTFAAKTRVMEGADRGPLLGLYPHHWFENRSVADRLGPAYDTVRGKLRLLAAAGFKTERPWQGFLPHWPGLADGPGLAAFNDEFKRDFRRRRDLLPSRENPDNWRVSPYWAGLGLTRVTQLAAVAEQQGLISERDQLLALAKERMEFWFGGTGKASYFMLDRKLGTLVAYPDEFFSVEQMNDHHFHYGYWIRAAAEIALRDPAWAAKERYGAVVELLIKDIANTQRGSADFPYLRNHDAYEGHSWAVGIGGVGPYGNFGNNQESSSEAVNAWAALILWGEVTGNRELRDLGIYLYANETNAIDHYWFDRHHLVFPPGYKPVETSMVFGGMFVHNTWWTDEPRQIHGINLLPVAGFSTYLGRDPAFIERNLAAMESESAAYKQRGKFPPNPPPEDIWQDVFAKYLALADPAAALARFKPRGSVQDGNTATHTLHWMLSLQAMGTPDFGVTADTALYQVFKRADGRRSHLAFNAGALPITVHFSDGQQLVVAPGTLGRSP